MMTKNEMMQKVYNQLSLDYNCQPSDFLKDDIIFTVSKELNGRRALPFAEPRLEVLTFGRGMIVNASDNIMDYVKSQFANKSKLEIINSPLLKSFNPYYLPNLDRFESIKNDFCQYKIIQRNEILELYELPNMINALQYNKKSERPEMMGVIALKDNKIAGLACASKDSDTMWQIGVDVLSEYRGSGIAVSLVNMLSKECLNKNIVPYYTTDIGNINSQRVAVKSGFFPVWSHCFRARVSNNIITNLLISKI